VDVRSWLKIPVVGDVGAGVYIISPYPEMNISEIARWILILRLAIAAVI
jgi:hypothetical protein